MNPLTSRKKLLIAESELNRAQLFNDWQELAGEVNGLSKQFKTVGFIASTAASLISGVTALRQKKPRPLLKKLRGCQRF